MFKPGDRVRCIEPGSSKLLTMNKIFIIYEVDEECDRVYLEGMRNYDWYSHRFVLANKKNVPKEIV